MTVGEVARDTARGDEGAAETRVATSKEVIDAITEGIATVGGESDSQHRRREAKEQHHEGASILYRDGWTQGIRGSTLSAN